SRHLDVQVNPGRSLLRSPKCVAIDCERAGSRLECADGIRSPPVTTFSKRDGMSERSRWKSPASFPSTHWSLVARARGAWSPDAREALDLLCRAYWFPIYAFIRRHGTEAEAARDLTQTYFSRLLEKDLLLAANPQKGRFRSFLKTDCTYFLADQRDRERAQKRGGVRALIPFEALDAEDRYRRELADELTPERQFDRTWALSLLDRVLDQLGAEYAESGRAALFERLRITVTPGSALSSYADVAA